jgi:hypothetical protein
MGESLVLLPIVLDEPYQHDLPAFLVSAFPAYHPRGPMEDHERIFLEGIPYWPHLGLFYFCFLVLDDKTIKNQDFYTRLEVTVTS